MAPSHKANVIEPNARPTLAHLDLPANIAARPVRNDSGGAKIIAIPARNPKGEPHPKPGKPSNCAAAKSQGAIARQMLISPILLDFILLHSFQRTMYVSLSGIAAHGMCCVFVVVESFQRPPYLEQQII